MMQYGPEWSAGVLVDYFTDVSHASMILTLCLEQIDENPPDLIPRLYWLISTLQGQMETIGEDGSVNAERVRKHLCLSDLEEDQHDRPED